MPCTRLKRESRYSFGGFRSVTRHAPARGLLGIACSLIGVGLAVAAIAVLIASFVTENDCDEILMLRAHVERTNNEERADTAHDSRDTPELA